MHVGNGEHVTTERTRVALWSEVPSQLWRVVEADGLPARRWLPWEPDEGPLDRYGFKRFFSAQFFALGVDLIRAEAGLLRGVTVDDIEAERARAERLESSKGKTPSPAELDAFGLDAYDHRKLRQRERRQWHVERALQLVSAL